MRGRSTHFYDEFFVQKDYLATYHYAIYPRNTQRENVNIWLRAITQTVGCNQNKGIYKAANKMGLRFMELSPTNCGL